MKKGVGVVFHINTPKRVLKASQTSWNSRVGRVGSLLVESEAFSMKFISPHTNVGTEVSRVRRDLMILVFSANSPPRHEVKVKKLKGGTCG